MRSTAFEGKAIVTMEEVTEYLYNREHDGRSIYIIKAAIDEYYKQYGEKEKINCLAEENVTGISL